VRDNLTGLFSRCYVEESLEREVVRAHLQNRVVSLVIFGLDHFGHFREECGHAAGAILLQAVAQVIQSQTRPTDFACRYRSGEFALAMPEAPAKVSCDRAENMRAEIRKMGWCHNKSLSGPVTLSVGVAAFPDHAADKASLLQAAETELIRATEWGATELSLRRQAER
jgi:diguanylate cyclase (GGDEF)-like protein